jgi:RAB protein geranylgeranyltransferase component A
MDDYYDKLPFVLDREQYEQEFLVLGTGLLECLLAAHLTKMQQRKGIVIDTEKTYGSTMKTLSLREFHEAMSSQHQDTESKLPIKLLLTEN